MTELAIFTHNLKLGGAQRVIVNIANELYKRGKKIEIILMHKQGDLLSQLHKNVSVVDLNTNPFIQAVRDLRTYLNHNQPATLLSAITTADLMAELATKSIKTDIRHVAQIVTSPSRKMEKYDKMITDRPIPYLMRWLYPRMERLIAVSNGVKQELIEEFEVSSHRIETIYNPIVTEDLLTKATKPVDHPWFTDESIETVLGVGRLAEAKDFSTLLRAFELILDERNAKLVILGEGSKRDHLEDLTRELGIEDDVSIPGTVSNPYSYMNRANLLALSSQWEGFGNVIVEALACGCPVVATDCPYGPREILQDGKYGSLVPVGDYKTLSKHCIEVLESPPESNKLKTRAEDFHINKITSVYEEVLY